MSFKTLFLLHFAATAMMTGVIWIIQLVHYPLFEQVGSGGFQSYITNHASRITWVVLPLMGIELISGVLLAFKPELPFNPNWAYLGLFLIALIWLSTAFLQVPIHSNLAKLGYDVTLIQKLVSGNWLRTISWTLRLALLFYLASLSFKLL